MSLTVMLSELAVICRCVFSRFCWSVVTFIALSMCFTCFLQFYFDHYFCSVSIISISFPWRLLLQLYVVYFVSSRVCHVVPTKVWSTLWRDPSFSLVVLLCFFHGAVDRPYAFLPQCNLEPRTNQQMVFNVWSEHTMAPYVWSFWATRQWQRKPS